MPVRTPSLRDYVWGSVAGFVAVCAILGLLGDVVAAVWFLAHLRYLAALRLAGINVPATALGGYWIGAGAWRRTTWGAPSEEQRAAASVPLSERQAGHLWMMIILGTVCAVALSLALGTQALIGHWWTR